MTIERLTRGGKYRGWITYHAMQRCASRLMRDAAAAACADRREAIERGEEWICDWLKVYAARAILQGVPEDPERRRWRLDGIVFVFGNSLCTLVTVYPDAPRVEAPKRAGKRSRLRRRMRWARRTRNAYERDLGKHAKRRGDKRDDERWEDAA
ncbi:MAG: hypothetical protein KF684_04230 [Phycisphaeraceae bacterium]|nr:hypothetical protein [Phycisphaeraceae bacterium]